jgi:hypothetical protein
MDRSEYSCRGSAATCRRLNDTSSCDGTCRSEDMSDTSCRIATRPSSAASFSIFIAASTFLMLPSQHPAFIA